MTTAKRPVRRRRRAAPHDGAPSARELIEESKRLGADVADIAAAAAHAARGWEQLLRHQLDARPVATLAVAAGIGYVLGGGLRSSVARTLAGVGARLVAERALAQLVDPDGDT